MSVVVLIGTVIVIFGSYWVFVKVNRPEQSDSKQGQIQLIDCNTNLNRALEIITNMTQQLNEANKAKELADKSLRDTENARKTTEEQLNQFKQQVQLLITQKTTVEEKIKEKEREIAEKDEKIIDLTAQCNKPHHEKPDNYGGPGKRHHHKDHHHHKQHHHKKHHHHHKHCACHHNKHLHHHKYHHHNKHPHHHKHHHHNKHHHHHKHHHHNKHPHHHKHHHHNKHHHHKHHHHNKHLHHHKHHRRH